MNGSKQSAAVHRNAAALRIVMPLLVILAAVSCIPDPEIPASGRRVPLLGRELYVLNDLAETLSVIDPGTLEVYNDALVLGRWPNAIAYRGGLLYVVCSGDNAVRIYDRETFEETDRIYLGKNANPWSFITAGTTEKAYVPNFVSGDVAVIDLPTNEVVKRIPALAGLEGGAYIDGSVYVCSSGWESSLGGFGRGKVAVIDTATDEATATIDLEGASYVPGRGSNPQSAIAFPELHELHVVCTGRNGGADSDDGRIVIIDTDPDSATRNTVIGELPIGGSPGWTGGGIDTARKIVYLAGVSGLQSYSYGEGVGSGDPPAVLHGSNNVIPVPASGGDFLSGVTVDGVNDRLFVCNFTDDTVIVLDGGDYSLIRVLGGSDGTKAPLLVEP